MQFTAVHISTVHRAVKTGSIQLTEVDTNLLRNLTFNFLAMKLFGYELMNELITWTICRDAVASKKFDLKK